MHFVDRVVATKSSPAHLDFQPESLDLPGQEKKSAGKTFSNGKSELWEQSMRKVAFNAHPRKLVSKAVLVSQNDEVGICITGRHTSQNVPDIGSLLGSRHLPQRGR